MNRISRPVALATGVAALLATIAIAARAPLEDSTVTFGTPARDGTASISVEIKYEDENGKQQKTTLTGSTDVTNATTATEKREGLQEKLQTAIDDNEVAGEPLIELTGGSHSLIIATNSTPAAQNVTVKAVLSNDKKTGEKDKLPKNVSGPCIAEIRAEGDITGVATVATPPAFSVLTAEGEIAVVLTGNMEKVDLLWELQEGLQAQGATAFVDQERLALLVLLDDETFQWIAAGSTDNGITSVCKVMAP